MGEEFTLAEEKLADKIVHLTNVAVQRNHPDYKERMKNGDVVWSREELQMYLDKSGVGGDVSEVWVAMKKIMHSVFDAAKPGLEPAKGQFELFGLDFVLDEQLKPWLIEVNTNPAMWTNCSVTTELMPKLVASTLDAAIAANEGEQVPLGIFEMLIDSAMHGECPIDCMSTFKMLDC